MELYKKYRPKKWKQVVGNTSVVNTLRGMVKNDSIPQTILLHGPSGCGKTTLARILAGKLGAGGVDFMEMNSSSYRGIDSVRDMAHVSSLCPMGDNRVWILDEVHKLTTDAQDAILKLLEDTPARTYFILCTTNPEKLSKAIRTRCCSLVVASIQEEDLGVLLDRVCGCEKIKMSDSHREDIIDSSDGSARSMLVVLDRLSNIDVKEWDEAIKLKGGVDSKEVIDLCRALCKPKTLWKEISKILKGIDADPESVRWAVLMYAKAVLLNRGDSLSFLVIECFSDNFYDTKMAGLVASCYAVINGDN